MKKTVRNLSALALAVCLCSALSPSAYALAINIDDVLSVANTCKAYLIAIAVILVIAIVAIIAVKGMPKAKKFVIRWQSALAGFVAIAIVVNMICFGPMSTLISLATGAGTVSEETAAEANALCTTIAEEGMVLVKNEGNALPLAQGTKLNVFGWSSTNPVYGGTGSGALSDAYETTSLLQGLTDAGFELNTTISDFYTAFRATRPTVGMWGQDWTIPEPTMDEYNEAGIFENAKEFSDTAVIVIGRSGGEGADLPTSLDPAVEDTFQEGGAFGSSGMRYSSQTDDLDASKTYLELSNREQAMVDRVTSEFANVVVVINSANAMELGWLNDYPAIKGAIITAGAGQTGFEALGTILNGTVNPSAKTADTYVADLTTTPTFNNAGDLSYDNMDEFAVDGEAPNFVNYVEGIYVGYKFYETAAAEGLIDYDKSIVYPFGYGLSYTTFTQDMGALSTDAEGNISFDVTVTNTGSVAGKDVVEVYYNPPYTNGGIEKASANLVATAKTGIMEAGASETVTITFNQTDMASYDTYGAGCYVLEQGDYTISINSDAHNIIAQQTYNVPATITYDENNPRSGDQVAAVNQFTDVEGDVTYLSRADKFANYAAATAAPASYSMSDAHKATFINNSNYDPTAYNNDADEMPTTGASNGMTLAQMRGLDYSDPSWDTLLDQLTITDMDAIISTAGYQTQAAASVSKMSTIDCDGPASINNNFTGAGSIGFPAAVMIASTWNTDLAHQFGASIGKMANEMDVSGWYAPAMNTHRTAFAGRNFEYYSEDGYLSGAMASAAVIGAEESGVYAYIKHFALNDQEINRCNMLCTWANEQSIREIYLKAFEMCVKKGGAKAVMSSFNYLGTTWAGAFAPLQKTVLRDEWGFIGFVLTDYFGVYGYMNSDQAIRNGTDTMLVNYDTETNHVKDQTSATSVKAMREACHNVMYTVVNSRTYSEENLNKGMDAWKIAAIVIDVVLAAVVVALELTVVRKGYAKRKED